MAKPIRSLISPNEQATKKDERAAIFCARSLAKPDFYKLATIGHLFSLLPSNLRNMQETKMPDLKRRRQVGLKKLVSEN